MLGFSKLKAQKKKLLKEIEELEIEKNRVGNLGKLFKVECCQYCGKVPDTKYRMNVFPTRVIFCLDCLRKIKKELEDI